jgi:hypothetical protein
MAGASVLLLSSRDQEIAIDAMRSSRWSHNPLPLFIYCSSPTWAAFIGRPFCYCAIAHPHLGVSRMTAQGAGSRSYAAGLNAQRTSAFKCARTIRGRPSRLSSAHSQSSFLSSATDCFRLLRPANWAKHSFGPWLTAAAKRRRYLSDLPTGAAPISRACSSSRSSALP